jgi:MerR family transcriptional regulator, light-induced transcriptional regulator
MNRPRPEVTAIDRAVYESYLDHLVAGRRLECRRVLASLLEAGTPLRTIYERLFQDSLYEVGALWESGRASVATEHLATAITEDLLTAVFPSVIPERTNGRSAVVSCVGSEYHQIGGRIVADTLELGGWDVKFLGANTPEQALVDVVRTRPPDFLALSVSLLAHLASAERAIRLIRDVAPALPIVLGGQGATMAGASVAAWAADVHVLTSLSDLDEWIRLRFH